MKVSFESTYLASQQANLFSQWDTTVYFEEGESESRFNESSLVLPPIQKKLLVCKSRALRSYNSFAADN